MAIAVEEIPKIAFLFILLGMSGFATVWFADLIRQEISREAAD